LPPHQYVIRRRVERAQHLLRADGGLSLVEIALRVGFSDQSQFSSHFKRIVGITPGQFRTRNNSLKMREIRQELEPEPCEVFLQQDA
jgi:AraC-like DNA-binding protein